MTSLSYTCLFHSFIYHVEDLLRNVIYLGIIANSSNYQGKTEYSLSKEKVKTF